MEFDGALSLVQGTICSLGSQGLLNKDDCFQEAVETLRNSIQNLGDDVKSKAVFFMVLNTQLSVSEELRNDELVGLFTNITPPIEIGYLIKYLYHLNLQRELFKVIENCPGALSIELMDAILEKLEDAKFHRDEFGLEHFYQLWQSVFVKICKISTGLHANDYLHKFMFYFDHIYDLIQKVIVTSMMIKDLESIVGLHLYNFFKSFLFCLKMQKNPNVSDEPLYKQSLEFNHEETKVVENPVAVCIDSIFNKVSKILENFTLDLWMTFTECYFEFDLKNSVQFLIGNVVYNILEELKGCSVPSEVLNCFSSLAINKLTSASLDDIISNIRNGEKEWFPALVNHPCVTDIDSVKCLTDNIKLASPDELNTILNVFYEHICSPEQNRNLDSMKDLFLTAVKRSPQYTDWLKKVLDNKPNLLTTAHTQDDLTETFNKISKERNLPKEKLMSLCMQSPQETIKRIFRLTISGSLQIKDVTQLFKVLQYPCNNSQYDGPACLDCVVFKSLLLEELTDREKQSLLDLIVQMGKKDLLGPLFARNLMAALKVQVEKIEFEKAVLCLEIIKMLFNLDLLVIDKAVLLVYLSQVLEHFTWDLETFSTVKADGRDSIISIVTLILNRLDLQANDSKVSWARKEVLKCCEVNLACFCGLWFRFGCSWPSSGNFRSCILAMAHSSSNALHLTNFTNRFGELLDLRVSIVLSLTMLLPVVTFPEWNSIFETLIGLGERGNLEKNNAYYHVLDMFVSSLYLLTLTLTGSAMYPCYEYCLRNLGKLTRRSCPNMTGESLVQTLEKIFFVLSAMEDKEERKSCWMTFLPVLLKVIEWVKEKNVLDEHRSEIKKMLRWLEFDEVAEALEKRIC